MRAASVLLLQHSPRVEPLNESLRPCHYSAGARWTQAKAVTRVRINVQFRGSAALLHRQVQLGQALANVLPVVLAANKRNAGGVDSLLNVASLGIAG